MLRLLSQRGGHAPRRLTLATTQVCGVSVLRRIARSLQDASKQPENAGRIRLDVWRGCGVFVLRRITRRLYSGTCTITIDGPVVVTTSYPNGAPSDPLLEATSCGANPASSVAEEGDAIGAVAAGSTLEAAGMLGAPVFRVRVAMAAGFACADGFSLAWARAMREAGWSA